MRYHTLAFLMLFASQAGAEQCVHVIDRQLEQTDPDKTVPGTTWKASLENRCNAPYQADLTIQFIDEAEEPVYEVRHTVAIARNSTVEVEKEAYIPDRYAEAAVSFEVKIVERERPY